MYKKLNICSKDCEKIIDIIENYGGEIRLVGGVVRDALLNIESQDIDLATTLSPQEVIESLEAKNIRVLKTGIDFGTVTAIVNQELYQITSLREDIECDGRYAKVRFTKDFQKDASRRDFTINALSYSPKKHMIFDYFNGIEDLYASRVVFIGQADQRIKEDYLRILRFFRFSCKYAKEIDSDSLNACIRNKCGLQYISKYRAKEEFDLFLDISPNKNFHKFLEIIIDNNILGQVFTGVKIFDKIFLERILFWSKRLKIKIDRHLLYVIIFSNKDDLSVNHLIKLSFSKKESRKIFLGVGYYLGLGKNIMSTVDIQILLTKIFIKCKDDYNQYLLITLSQISDDRVVQKHLENKLFLESVPKSDLLFPLGGEDLLSLGYKRVRIGSTLDKLQAEWIKKKFQMNKSELIELAKKMV